MEKQNSPTRSVERALDILECFLEKKEMILLEIAEKTGLSSSTALRILSTLQESGFVVKNPQNKTYHLGSKILWLADMVPSESYEELKVIARPHLEELNRLYNEDVRLFVPDGNSKLCIESVESTRELRQVVKIGSRHDLLRGAAGKVILAYMTSHERKKIVGGIEEEEKIFQEIREKGFALSIGEREEGLCGVAVPIVNRENQLIAAVSLSGPTTRFENGGFEEKKQALIRMGKNISADYAAKQEA